VNYKVAFTSGAKQVSIKIQVLLLATLPVDRPVQNREPLSMFCLPDLFQLKYDIVLKLHLQGLETKYFVAEAMNVLC
jgi:hypothetical protein